MKKTNMILALSLLAATSFAATPATISHTHAANTTRVAKTPGKQNEQGLRQDIRDKRSDTRKEKTDLAKGKTARANNMATNISQDKAAISAQKTSAKTDGVKHADRKAARQIRKAKNGKVITDGPVVTPGTTTSNQ